MSKWNRVLVAVVCLPLAPALASAVSTSGQELSEALRATPDPVHGAELFRNCAVCHGPTGGGTIDGGVPRIAGQHTSVLAKELVDYRHDRRWDIRMEHFADNHHLPDPQSIADVASYAHHLIPVKPPGIGDGQLVGRGEAIYAHRCSSCHGPAAGGDAKKRIPRIHGARAAAGAAGARGHRRAGGLSLAPCGAGGAAGYC